MDKDKENQNGQENALKQMKMLLMIVLVLTLAAPLLSTTMAVKSIDGKLAKLKMGEAGNDHEAKSQKELPMSFYQPMEFLVNLGDTDANHYLRATLSLGVRLTEADIKHHEEAAKSGGGGHGGKAEDHGPQPVLFTHLKTQEPIVRDIVISVISNYTMDDLVSTAGKTELKETIKNKLREQLHNDHLEIYFTSFTLQ